jgi:hypothetical protein
LPETGLVTGRAGNPRSHYWYLADPPLATAQFKDPTGTHDMLVELRSLKSDGGFGLQTLVPSSVHPDSGERYEFYSCGKPVNVEGDALEAAVHKIAAGALLARHWPDHGRHSCELALAGTLARAGWSEHDASTFVLATYRAVRTHDPNAFERVATAVRDTYSKAASNTEITGVPSLIECIDNEKVVTIVLKWLGIECSHKKTNRDVSIFSDDGGSIVRRVGVNTIPLTSGFTARITAKVTLDDGIAPTSHFEIAGTVAGHPYTCAVPAAKFADMDWVIPAAGPRAIIFPKQEPWTRVAIQTLSTNVAARRIYTHTGWLEAGRGRVYLHASGAIGTEGQVNNIEVQLHGNLSRYALVLPADDEQARQAVRASLRVLDVGKDRITVPALASAYRACLDSCDFSVYFFGHTGLFKTALASLAQQHYGASMDARNLPANFLSTANALEVLASQAKDALLVADDFSPSGTTQDIARAHNNAERLFRAQGNNQSRQRLRSDGTLQRERVPRGLVLASGEDLPRSQSIRARVFMVEFAPGDINKEKLTAAQIDAGVGLYSQALAAFIRFVAANYKNLREHLHKRVIELRAQVAGTHARTPLIIGELYAGFELFLEFATFVGAVTRSEAAEIDQRAIAALGHVAAAQDAPLRAADPALRFIDLIVAAFLRGEAHLKGPTGDQPVRTGKRGAGSGPKKGDMTAFSQKENRLGGLTSEPATRCTSTWR